MILMQGVKKDGKRGRACNARCYNARGTTCRCICGGMNHGKGEEAAMKNVREICGKGELKKGCFYTILPHQRRLEFPKMG